jgi:MFS family permease
MARAFWILAVMLLAEATFSVVFFPAGIVAISRLTHLSERGMFTGMLMGISSIVGPGLSPFFLGLIADAWTFQVGILMMGVLTTLSCFLIRFLRDI